MDDSIILQNNLTFLFLCEDIILSKRKLFGTNIRQEGYLTASLGAYLSFWKTWLPYSVDVNGNPLTSISKEGCRAYNFQTDCIEPTSIDFPIKVIIEKFDECRKEFKRSHNDPTLLDVVASLQHQLEEGGKPKSMYAWEIFRQKCRIASLETKIDILKSENTSVKNKLRTEKDDAVKLLAEYANLIRQGEDTYNSRFDNCIEKIAVYQEALRKLRFDRLHGSVRVVVDRTKDNAYKDAVKYWQYRLRNLFAFQYRSLPEEVKALPIETINDVCNTNLKIYIPKVKRN